MEAVFALIGVGLGTFISGGFSLVLERRALKESDTAFLQASRPTLARALEALGQRTRRPA